MVAPAVKRGFIAPGLLASLPDDDVDLLTDVDRHLHRAKLRPSGTRRASQNLKRERGRRACRRCYRLTAARSAAVKARASGNGGRE
jgi:hypothetical protein